MFRFTITAKPLLSAAAAALALSLTAPAFAQAGPPSLPRALEPIPEVSEAPFPGLIQHHVDATDLNRRIIHVSQTIPVSQPGPMVLLYPKYLPGNHGPTGPITQVAGLRINGDTGDAIAWLRDTAEPYAFHIIVPEGVEELEVNFDVLTPLAGQGRVVLTQTMLNLQWEKLVLYPAGYRFTTIEVQTRVTLPDGWDYAVALDTQQRSGNTVTFAPVSLDVLGDSPLFAGPHYRQFEIGNTVALDLFADDPAELTAAASHMQPYENLVVQADRLFGAHHFDHYNFLVGATDTLGGIGLEHHRSSENTIVEDFFRNLDNAPYGDLELLPHEYVHSWNGKFRRPADQLMDNYNEPLQNSLLWVYEGQTQYWGAVLGTRSGIISPGLARANLAWIAAFYDAQPGRQWRALQDTTNQNLLGYRSSSSFPTWSRTGGDYYRESLLMWLDADTLIREATNNERSLDDFARGFFGVDDGVWSPSPYRIDDVVAVLNDVYPHDWEGFLRTRLDAVGDDATAPLDGIERGGWRLVFDAQPSADFRRYRSNWGRDFTFSLGLSLSGETHINSVLWGSPAFDAGLAADQELVSVNGRSATAQRLRQAVTDAARTGEAIRLIVRQGDYLRDVEIDYRGGLRYPRLERIEGTPDRLSDILSPRED